MHNGIHLFRHVSHALFNPAAAIPAEILLCALKVKVKLFCYTGEVQNPKSGRTKKVSIMGMRQVAAVTVMQMRCCFRGRITLPEREREREREEQRNKGC